MTYKPFNILNITAQLGILEAKFEPLSQQYENISQVCIMSHDTSHDTSHDSSMKIYHRFVLCHMTHHMTHSMTHHLTHIVARGPKPCKSTFSGDAKNEMRSKKRNQ